MRHGKHATRPSRLHIEAMADEVVRVANGGKRMPMSGKKPGQYKMKAM